MPPDAPRRVLIVGATSAIAAETARAYAAYGARLFLTGRNPERLQAVAEDLKVRGASAVETAVLDVTDRRRAAEMIDAAWSAFGGLDVALLAHGVLPDQHRCQASADETARRPRGQLRLDGRAPDAARGALRRCARRMHRRHHVGRGGPGPAEQLRLRRRQGRSGPVPGGSSEPAVPLGRRGGYPQARLRGYADDRRAPAGAAVRQRANGGKSHPPGDRSDGATSLTSRGSGGRS